MKSVLVECGFSFVSSALWKKCDDTKAAEKLSWTKYVSLKGGLKLSF